MNKPVVAILEAKGLAAPGYMGLPQAYHIFLVSADNTCGWPCFGRGRECEVGSIAIGAFPVFVDWAKALAGPDSSEQYLAGVANTVNGTCHTIANRILALSEEEHANVSASVDDAYSVLVFGKYGYGTRQFCKLLEKSAAMASIPPALVEKVQRRVQNPFEDELSAWCRVVQQETQMDIQTWVHSNPAVKQTALTYVAAWHQERDQIYEANFSYETGRAPNKNEIKNITNTLKTQATKHLGNILASLEQSGMISQSQRKAIEAQLLSFVGNLGTA